MADKLYSVYVIVNLVNGKCYVGITTRRLVDRVAEHIARAKGTSRNNRLAAAMRKYGFDNFGAFIESEYSSEHLARAAEKVAIHKYNSYKDGYNCNYGGHGNLNISEETKQRISAAQKGKVIPFEQRVKMSAAKLGRKECADNFGAYAQAGHGLDTNAKIHKVEFPDGHVEEVLNLAKFCRMHDLSVVQLHKGASSKEFKLLDDRFKRRPKARETEVQHPDGSNEVVNNFAQFLRDHNLTSTDRAYLYRGQVVKGYKILRRFDGHSERKYAQAGGSGGCPISRKGIVEVDL